MADLAPSSLAKRRETVERRLRYAAEVNDLRAQGFCFPRDELGRKARHAAVKWISSLSPAQKLKLERASR
jgi:hypothetical protein